MTDTRVILYKGLDCSFLFIKKKYLSKIIVNDLREQVGKHRSGKKYTDTVKFNLTLHPVIPLYSDGIPRANTCLGRGRLFRIQGTRFIYATRIARSREIESRTRSLYRDAMGFGRYLDAISVGGYCCHSDVIYSCGRA